MRKPKTMRKLLLFLALLAPTYCFGQAQSDISIGPAVLNTACTNANTSCDTVNTNFGTNGVVLGPASIEGSTQGYGLVVITMNGATTTASGATISFEFSDDGGTSWYPNVCTRTDANIQEGSEAVPASTYRAWDCAVGAATRFRVRLTAVSSGNVVLRATLTTGLLEPALTVSQTNTVGSSDPCANPGVLKSSAFPANITTATTTSIIAASGTTAIYLCGFQITSFDTTTANTIQLEYGTGAACVTTQVPITPVYTSPVLAAGNAPFVMSLGFSGSSVLKASAAGSALCAVSTVGSTPVIQVLVTYVQQ